MKIKHSKTKRSRKQDGGYILDLLLGKKLKRRTKKKGKGEEPKKTRRRVKARISAKATALEEAITSETDLIHSYEAMSEAARDYYEDYNTHLQNLISLDDLNGMTGLQTTFKNVLTKSLFRGTETVDLSNPLLLRNYSVTEDTTPKYFRKEHLMRQIRYCLANEFILKDSILVSTWDLDFVDNMAVIKVTTMNGEKHEFKVPVDAQYNMDMSQLKEELTDVIISVKKKMDYVIDVGDFKYKDLVVEMPPGLDYTTEKTLDAKLKALKKSVAIDEAVLNKNKSVSKAEPTGPVYKEAGLIVFPQKPKSVQAQPTQIRAEYLPVGQNTLQMTTAAQNTATTNLLYDIMQKGPATALSPTPVVPVAGEAAVSCPQYDGNEAECRAKGCFYNKFTQKCVIDMKKQFLPKT